MIAADGGRFQRKQRAAGAEISSSRLRLGIPIRETHDAGIFSP
jgi:hypothetical protein